MFHAATNRFRQLRRNLIQKTKPNQCLPQTLRIPYIGVRLKSKGPLSAPCIFIATKSAEFLKVFFPSLARTVSIRCFIFYCLCVAVSHCKYSGFPAVSHDAPMKHGAVTLGLLPWAAFNELTSWCTLFLNHLKVNPL